VLSMAVAKNGTGVQLPAFDLLLDIEWEDFDGYAV
jgi:hypothetical protein